MTAPSEKYLSDMLHAIELIEEFMGGCDSFDAYRNDLKTKSAVERQLEILGEAMNALRKHGAGDVLSHTHQIVAVRNRLIHAYDSIDDTIVWAIYRKHLPVLKEEVLVALRA